MRSVAPGPTARELSPVLTLGYTTLRQLPKLRRNLTPAEALLWASLRKSQLDGKKFRRQHSIGSYIVDFYCPECRVIVELDGAGYTGMLNVERDDNRTKFLEKFGIEVLRFENKEVFENRERVVEAIRAVLRSRA
jgi:very-short-patch-repair endonuclease